MNEMSMKQRWIDTDRRKLKYVEKSLSQYHFVHHKSHRDWIAIELDPVWCQARDWPPKTNIATENLLCTRNTTKMPSYFNVQESTYTVSAG